MANFEVGQELYAFSTGAVMIFNKKSRKAVELIGKQDGFVGVNPMGRCTLWFFDSENNAKKCRNVIRLSGIEYGKNISKFVVSKDGIPTFDSQYAKENGMV